MRYILYNYTYYIDTQDFRFPIDMDPLKLLVSVIYNTESIQKEMEAKLSRERELSETYRKRSLVTMGELHAKEMQIKKIQSMKIESQSGMFIYVSELLLLYNYMNLVGVDDEALQPEEVLLETKDEHKGDKVQILLEGEFYKYMYIQAVASMVPISTLSYL